MTEFPSKTTANRPFLRSDWGLQSHFCPMDFFGLDGYLRVKARYPSGKGEVCKTFMRRFDSDPRLQSL